MPDQGRSWTENAASASTLQVEGLTHRWGDTVALRGVSLSAGQGEIVLVVGDNGAGKSTLLDILAGRVDPTAGKRRILGRSVHVRQDPPYPGELTVAQVLRTGPWGYDTWSVAQAVDLAAKLELPLDRQVWRLSRGMKSAIGMVIGIASQAPIMLFDEPFLGVDVRSARVFGDALRAEGAAGRVCIVATIRPELLRGFADRIVVLRDGEVREDLPASDEVFETLEF